MHLIPWLLKFLALLTLFSDITVYLFLRNYIGGYSGIITNRNHVQIYKNKSEVAINQSCPWKFIVTTWVLYLFIPINTADICTKRLVTHVAFIPPWAVCCALLPLISIHWPEELKSPVIGRRRVAQIFTAALVHSVHTINHHGNCCSLECFNCPSCL